MALSTSGKTMVGGRLIWTPEEDSVLIEAWKMNMTPSGRASDGFVAHLQSLFPHRSFESVRKHKSELVRRGKFPRVRQRCNYVPLALSPTEAAWLSATFEGEGSIADFFYKTKITRHSPVRTIRLCLCYNTDPGMIRKVRTLVPNSYLKTRTAELMNRKNAEKNRTIRSLKDITTVCLTNQAAMADFLRQVLPYMAHEEKRLKSLRALEWLESRLA